MQSEYHALGMGDCVGVFMIIIGLVVEVDFARGFVQNKETQFYGDFSVWFYLWG